MMEVLQNPRFRAVWYVISVAEVTRWMELLVTSVLVYSLTDSALMLGLVLAFENLPGSAKMRITNGHQLRTSL